MEMVHCMDLLWNSSPSSPKSLLCHVKLVLWSVITTKKRKRKRKHISKVKKKIKSINIFNQILVPLHPHGNKDFIENRKEKVKKRKEKRTQAIICTTVWEREYILSSSTNTVAPKTKLVKQKVTAEARRSRMKNILNFLDKQTKLLKAKKFGVQNGVKLLYMLERDHWI